MLVVTGHMSVCACEHVPVFVYMHGGVGYTSFECVFACVWVYEGVHKCLCFSIPITFLSRPSSQFSAATLSLPGLLLFLPQGYMYLSPLLTLLISGPLQVPPSQEPSWICQAQVPHLGEHWQF